MDMSDFINRLLGRRIDEVNLKNPYGEGTIGYETGADTRLKPSREGKKFLEIKSASIALEFLQHRYETLKPEEALEMQNPGSVPDFPNKSLEYYMQLLRFNRETANIIGRKNQLTNEGKKLLDKMETFNKKIQYNVGGADKVVFLLSSEILLIATKLAFLKQAPINLNDNDNMTKYEHDYWHGRGER